MNQKHSIEESLELKKYVFRDKYQNMTAIQVTGGIKLEPITIKPETSIEENAVEVGIDDIFSESYEENILSIKKDNQDSDRNKNVAYEETDIEYKNFNKPDEYLDIKKIDKVENLQVIDEEENGSDEDFNVANNMQTSEKLVINFAKNEDGIHIITQEDKACTYRTFEGTSLQEDMKKVIVTEVPHSETRVAPHEYTTLARDKHVCNHCQHACRNLEQLKRHIRKAHREVVKLYQCPYCPFKTKWSLSQHIIFNHKDDKDINWFNCHLCEKKFKFKNHLSRHMNVHFTKEELQERLKTCRTCGKGFKDGKTLDRHVRFVHKKEIAKRQQCKECDYSCISYWLMTDHVAARHTDLQLQKTYNCEKCSYKTISKIQFLNHYKSHVRRFFCDKCAYAAATSTRLSLHQITHETEVDEQVLKYRCDKCDFKTYRSYNLSVHKLNHLKPDEIEFFYCYHCNFKSKRKDNLKRHIFRHNEVTLQCFRCDYTTNKKGLLIDHINKHSSAQTSK